MTSHTENSKNTAHQDLAPNQDMEGLVDVAIEQADKWLEVKETAPATKQLADMVHDPHGVEFTFSFVDRVARPEDNKVAAEEFAKIASPLKRTDPAPEFLGLIDTILVTAGSIAAPILPNVVMPIARKYLRSTVGHLVLDAGSETLDAMLDDAREKGFTLNLNLLGEAVLGEAEAKRRLQQTIDLIRNPKVEYVSVKASSVVSQLNHWDFRGSVDRLKDRLRPLYREAKRAGQGRSSKPTFVNLDMEAYEDLDLTLELFTELFAEEEFLDLEVGIVLQAYLPDSFDALQRLTEFAKQRVAQGGAKIKVRLVKGANLSMERVDAEMHNWPQTPYLTKAEVDANYLRLIDWVLNPENAEAIRIGVASHNVYHVALAHKLAEQRGVAEQLDIEMLQGMAPAQASEVQKKTGNLILYTPVVRKEDFDVAVSYLVRRLEENGAKQNFLYALFTPEEDDDTGLTPMENQEQRFRDAVADRWATYHGPRRTQDRIQEARDKVGATGGSIPGNFLNEPDTDPALAQNREWARSLLTPEADPGPAQSPLVTDPAEIDKVVQRAVETHEGAWGQKTGAERAELLDKVADSLANYRGRLISAAAFEADKTIAESDPEISEAIDMAHYYAESARQLDRHRGSNFTPYKVVVVTPPWNFPVAIPVGGVTAALAAGAAVILKPAPQVLRIAEVFVEAMREAGVGEDLLQLVNADEDEAGKRLISHPDVESVILTGASETAQLFRSWDPRKVLNAETSGKNAIIVTPAADPDLAVEDIYQSAFGNAGQKCSAASLIITVGSMSKNERFMNQLVDAVESIKVGRGTDISTYMNGIIEAPGEKLDRALRKLDKGEKWLVKPKQLDETGTLWSPGIRDNVQPGSWYHKNEAFGPVTGIMHAKDLDEAIEWQNSTGFALTGGIHTIDRDETAYWRERVEVGNAYVERGITGAIVQRQSFGGWKGSSIGSGAKAGGPNYVAQQGVWTEGNIEELTSGTVEPRITQLLREFRGLGSPVLEDVDHEWLRLAAESDAHAMAIEFGVEHDKSAMVVESNVFRYKPLLEPLRVRVNADAKARDVLRMLLGAAATSTEIDISASEDVAAQFGELGKSFRVASDLVFAAEISKAANSRIRSLGESPDSFYEAAVDSNSKIFDQPVLPDGHRELLTMLLEQNIATTEHRFGYIHGLTP